MMYDGNFNSTNRYMRYSFLTFGDLLHNLENGPLLEIQYHSIRAISIFWETKLLLGLMVGWLIVAACLISGVDVDEVDVDCDVHVDGSEDDVG